jgi:hypothetical protein
MANEWISLLQKAPTENVDPIKTFQESQSRAIANKKNAYDLYRSQKAQEIVGSSTRPDGSLDWDQMFKQGVQSGIGLDAFKQAHDMQKARAESESQLKQQQSLLRSMGENRNIWDPSAKPIDVMLRERAAEQNFEQVPGASTPEPFVAPSAEQANKYNFLTQGATSGPVSPVQESPVAPMAPAVGGGPVMDLGQKNVQVAQLPAPPMRDPNIDQGINDQGYFNQLWRDTSNFGNVEQMFGGGAIAGGAGAGSFDVSKMDNASKGRLEQYLADRGVAGADLQTAVNSLETRAIDSVPKPVMVQPEGTSFGDINKARNLNMKAVAEYAGKVAEAKIKFSEDMQKGNFGVLDKKMAQEANTRAEKAQDYDLSGLSPEDNPNLWKKVSRQELEKINTMQAGYDDYIMAANNYESNPSLGNLSALAVAKLKGNGQPITMDAVESYIMASGAVPKEKELIFKKALKDLDVKSLLGAGGLNWLNLGFTGTPMDDAKIGLEKKNLEFDIWRRGGLPYDNYMKPNGKTSNPREKKSDKTPSKPTKRSSEGM